MYSTNHSAIVKDEINVTVVDICSQGEIKQDFIGVLRNSLGFLYSLKITSVDNFNKNHKALRTCSYLFDYNLEILSSPHIFMNGWDYQSVIIPQVPLFANNMMYVNQCSHVTNVNTSEFPSRYGKIS